jgi:hypothetical protein
MTSTGEHTQMKKDSHITRIALHILYTSFKYLCRRAFEKNYEIKTMSIRSFFSRNHFRTRTRTSWSDTIMAVLPPTAWCIHYVALLGFCSMHAGSSKRPATPKPNRLAQSRWPTFLYTTVRKWEGTHTTGLKNVDPRRKYYYPTWMMYPFHLHTTIRLET